MLSLDSSINIRCVSLRGRLQRCQWCGMPVLERDRLTWRVVNVNGIYHLSHARVLKGEGLGWLAVSVCVFNVENSMHSAYFTKLQLRQY